MTKKPKIELHCHLDGSLRVETVIDLAQNEGIKLPTSNVSELKSYLTAPEDCPSLDEYLERFDLPISVLQTKEGLERAAFELMEDSAKDNVKYIEIRFAPLFHINKGLSIEEVMESVLSGIKKAEESYEIKGNVILSFLKFMPADTIYDVIERCSNYLGMGVVGVDLAGSEEEEFAHKFVKPMAHARELGYRVTIHAGETGFGINVLESVQLLGAERIGHGVDIRDCKEAYDIVREMGIFLEMCPTSNVQTKAVKNILDHPIVEFTKLDLPVTMNTDNRTVSNTTMSNELTLCTKNLHLTEEMYRKIYMNSIEATFATDEIKEWLRLFI